eukprot:GHVH01002304.1.p1 GENE.GHVH01002304.1~~GHVH01002304.1.p1  ORF type:complete len:669 (+),score=150.32 GHVH01002304.1:3551-5557(+)
MSESSDDWEAVLTDIKEEEEAKKVAKPTNKQSKIKKVPEAVVVSKVEDSELEGFTGAKRARLARMLNDDRSHFNMSVSGSDLRSPICCILGHVDTGKTKLLDKIRRTNVQGDEAGGITQQIGATFFTHEKLKEMCLKVNPRTDVLLPGLLIIDTPGHESFNNLRSRGTTLCDIAILVIDIHHGLEPQTKESIQLLKNKRAPFVIALNKVDRLFDWKSKEFTSFKKSFENQGQATKDHFDRLWKGIQLELWEESLNTTLWWENDDVKKTISVIPTSAMTGEGIPDLIFMLTGMTQKVMSKALTFRDEVQCTLLEVKHTEGFGCTIDVVLVNGELEEGDSIVVCGMKGPIVTTIRSLLTPKPMKEMRVRGEYVHHKKIRAAMGIKIAANDLEDAVSGTTVYKVLEDSDLPTLKEEVMKDMTDIFESVDSTGVGVYVQASTLGALEALLQFLKDSEIPVFAVNIGPITKGDITKASTMRERNPEFAVVLAFDVPFSKGAAQEAKNQEVTVFKADIIYHLFDQYTMYRNEQIKRKKEEMKKDAVFPCELSILPSAIFHKKDPIILGVKVERGTLKVGTPLCVLEKEVLKIGRVTALKMNDKPVEQGGVGDEVSVSIAGEPSVLAGRHFTDEDKLTSIVTRASINCMKDYYKDEMQKDDWKLMIKLKKAFKIL